MCLGVNVENEKSTPDNAFLLTSPNQHESRTQIGYRYIGGGANRKGQTHGVQMGLECYCC